MSDYVGSMTTLFRHAAFLSRAAFLLGRILETHVDFVTEGKLSEELA